MEIKIHPSPAIKAKADTPIRDCIERMKKNSIGALLIVSTDQSEQLLGIFTERDIIKNLEKMIQGSLWKRPVHLFMTRDLHTLPAHRLDQAGKMMLEHGFRHLPIVQNEGTVTRLVGVISIRDVVRSFIQDDTPLSKPPRKKKRLSNVGVLSNDRFYLTYIRTGLKNSGFAKLRKISSKRLRLDKKRLLEILRLKALIVDIDSQNPEDWIEFLKEVFDRIHTRPKVIVLFNPSVHSSRELSALGNASNLKRIHAVEKPFNINSLIDILR